MPQTTGAAHYLQRPRSIEASDEVNEVLSRILAGWRRHSFPVRLRDVACAVASYSQYGEDVVLRQFLRGTERGFYVDVGCFHPVKWSNTYGFYRMGWSGVAVDPNSAYRQLWARWRSRDVFVNVAVSDADGDLLYVEDRQHPHENRVVKNGEPGHDGTSGYTVPCVRLESLLSEHVASGQIIDLLTIDCEGHDLAVLRSNDFERYRPRMLVVEDHSKEESSEIDRFCQSQGYGCVSKCHVSRIYRDARPRM